MRGVLGADGGHQEHLLQPVQHLRTPDMLLALDGGQQRGTVLRVQAGPHAQAGPRGQQVLRTRYRRWAFANNSSTMITTTTTITANATAIATLPVWPCAFFSSACKSFLFTTSIAL